MFKMPRSIRNNNPGNLRTAKWILDNFKISIDDDGFVIFENPLDGLTALLRLLDSNVYKDLTIEEVINKYAPPFENDTNNYVNYICNPNRSTIRKDFILKNLSALQILELLKNIIIFEGGSPNLTYEPIKPYGD